MPTVPVAKAGHGRNVVFGIGLIGHEVLRIDRRSLAIDDPQTFGIGDDELFPHVADFGVAHDKNGLAKTLRQVERLDRQRIALFH